MLKIAGMWELGWNTPIKEIDLWEMILGEFEIDQFYMTPISGILNKYVTEREHLREIIDENKNITKVFVDITGEEELQNFIHPKNVLYIFGKVGPSAIAYKQKGDKSLRVNTPTMKSMLWPHQVCSIILYDRYIKQHGSNSNR
jgi:hypothetical protein